MSASLPSSLALTSIADGAEIIASDHRNNYSAVQVGVNGLIAMFNAASTKGDLLVPSGGGTWDRLGVGSNGQTLVADSSQSLGVKWAGGGLLTASGSGAQAFSNGISATIANWTQATHTNASMSGGVVTVTAAGVYLITVYGFWALGTNSRELVVTGSSARSGNASFADMAAAMAGQSKHQTVTGILDLNAGATITVTGFQDSGGSLNFTPQIFNVVQIAS